MKLPPVTCASLQPHPWERDHSGQALCPPYGEKEPHFFPLDLHSVRALCRRPRAAGVGEAGRLRPHFGLRSGRCGKGFALGACSAVIFRVHLPSHQAVS